MSISLVFCEDDVAALLSVVHNTLRAEADRHVLGSTVIAPDALRAYILARSIMVQAKEKMESIDTSTWGITFKAFKKLVKEAGAKLDVENAKAYTIRRKANRLLEEMEAKRA